MVAEEGESRAEEERRSMCVCMCLFVFVFLCIYLLLFVYVFIVSCVALCNPGAWLVKEGESRAEKERSSIRDLQRELSERR